jgi:hypothetical protein
MAWRPYRFTAADIGGWNWSGSAAEHQWIGILTARNTPDCSVDADRYQEPAANLAKFGQLDRRAGHSDRFNPSRFAINLDRSRSTSVNEKLQ